MKSGCKKLAKKIEGAQSKDKKNIIITVMVDVFGFSRGAAAARNFVYNLQKKAYTPGSYHPPGGYQSFKIDHNGYSINDHWLKEGKLPPFGDLGVALLEAGLKREVVDNLRITVRFLGIYDTVASYDPINLIPNFKKHIAKLHLHELGAPRKAVHFTAMDEHRENFSLTRMKIGIEKDFPGVHSDIGGSYYTGTEIIENLENSDYLPLWKLEEYRQELIKNHWFKEDQIKITDKFGNIVTLGGSSRKLRGERYLKKEYSYIPLHFMRDYSLPFMREYYLEGKLDRDYSIEGDETLVAAKNRLEPYVMGEEGGKKWEFISDEEWEREKQRKEEERIKKEIEANMEAIKERIDEIREKLEQTEEINSEEEKEGASLERVIIIGVRPQEVLRKLRNEYLHWSARRKGIGMDPNNDHKRREF